MTGSADGWLHGHSCDTRGSSSHTLGQILLGKNNGLCECVCVGMGAAINMTVI